MLHEEKLSSSALASVSYDSEGKELLVVMTSGKAYVYEGVAQAIFIDLLNAPSHGAFFAKNIRNDHAFEELSETGDAAIVQFRMGKKERGPAIDWTQLLKGSVREGAYVLSFD